MRRVVSFTLALLLLAAVHSDARVLVRPIVWPEGSELKAMAFNIRTSIAFDILDNWLLRRGEVVHVIREERPDIVAIQEADPWQIKYILAQLPEYYVITTSRGDQWRGYPSILVRRDRLVLRGASRLWFSAAPHIPESITWGNPKPRCFTTARLYDKKTRVTFSFASVHLDYQSPASRVESIHLLADWAVEQGENPVIIAGDFNEPGKSDVLGALRLVSLADFTNTQRLLDSSIVLHQPERGTLHGFTGKATKRVDMILVSEDIQVLGTKVVKYHEGSRYPSDHFPVTATLSFYQPGIKVAGYEPAYYAKAP